MKRLALPVVSIVVPFWGYAKGSLIYNGLNQKKELQWRLQVTPEHLGSRIWTFRRRRAADAPRCELRPLGAG